MQYDSFIDHIVAEGCQWTHGFNGPSGDLYQNKHNSRGSYLIRQDWVPWESIFIFCEDTDIQIPAHLQHRKADFDKLF